MAQTSRVSLVFDADTKRAQSQIDQLASSINKVLNVSTQSTGVTSLDKQLQVAAKDAAQLKVQLTNAFNTTTGKLDLTKFNESLKSSGMSLEKYQQSFSALGRTGDQAFSDLARSIATAEIPLRRSNGLLHDFATTMKNTVKWQLSSSIMHGFLSSIQSAMSYAQHLNANLNDIRIVTGQSAEEMARFAEQANRSAKELSTTTNQYAQAALIFYQQGLGDRAVKERTDAVIKMANVTGEAAKDVSSYMTAIWNNFDDGSKSLEYYADVITKLGAATAASSEEIAGGLEKFAAIGNTIGLSYEYATAMITTIVDKTRQSEEVVGTALKTILARIQGLNLGDTLDDGTTLNKYSNALASVGVQIKDTSGELRSMDAILNDLGAKWQTLSNDTQVALAQVVGGVRQYNQIISLMDNWDSFEMNVDLALNAEGELDEQAEIYAESWEGAQKRVQAALETIYSSLIKDEFFIGLNDTFATLLGFVDTLIDSFGGLKGVLASLGSVLFTVFGKQIESSLKNFTNNLVMATKSGQNQIVELQKKAQMLSVASAEKNKNSAVANAYKSEAQAQLLLLNNSKKLSDQELKIAEVLMQQHRARVDEAAAAGEELAVAEKRAAREKEILNMRLENAKAALQKAGLDPQDTQNDVQEIESYQNSLAGLGQLSDQVYDIIANGSLSAEERMKALNAVLTETKQKSGDWHGVAQMAFDAFSEQVKESGGDVDKLKAALTGLGVTSEQLGAALQGCVDDLLRVLDAARQNTNLNSTQRAEIERLISSINSYKAANERLKEAQENSGRAAKNTEQSYRSLEAYFKSVGTAAVTAQTKIVTFAQTLTTVVSVVNMAKGAIEVLKDDSKSLGEKILAVVSSFGMMIPMMTTMVTSLHAWGAAALAAGTKSMAASAGTLVAKLGEAVGWKVAEKSVWGYIVAVLAAAAPITAIIAVIAAVTAVIIGLYKTLSADSPAEAAEKNLKRIEKANKEAADEIRKTTKEIDEMYSTFDEYEDAYKALQQLTEGTEDWGTALANVKQMTQTLIESYPILADMIANPDKYGVTLSNIYDADGNIRPEILEDIEARTIQRSNLTTFGEAAKTDEGAVEATVNEYVLFRESLGTNVINAYTTNGHDWGAYSSTQEDITGLSSEMGIVFKEVLPLMTEYYGRMDEDTRQGYQSNLDFFTGENFLESLKLSDDYYNGEDFTDLGYALIANYLSTGYGAYRTDVSFGHREGNPEELMLYDNYTNNGGIIDWEFLQQNPELALAAMEESDNLQLQGSYRYGVIEQGVYNEETQEWTDVSRGILDAMDTVVTSEYADYTSAVDNLGAEGIGVGQAVLNQMGLTDSDGLRRTSSSFADMDAMAGRIVDEKVDEWMANPDNVLPTLEELESAFNLTSGESITTDKKGNYVVTTLDGEEEVVNTYTPDQMRRLYGYNQVSNEWANQGYASVGDWAVDQIGITDETERASTAAAINNYDAYGLEGLTLADMQLLSGETMAPYMIGTFDAETYGEQMGLMERASTELGRDDLTYGTVNALYGNQEEGSINSVSRNVIAGLGDTLSAERIEALGTSLGSGDISGARTQLEEMGATEEELQAYDDAAYRDRALISRYDGINYNEAMAATQELAGGGTIDEETYNKMVESGLNTTGLNRVGPDAYAGTVDWTQYLTDRKATQEALALVESGGTLTEDQQKLLGYTGADGQGSWEDYIASDIGQQAINSATAQINAIDDDWIVQDMAQFGWDYLNGLQEMGYEITDEARLAASQADAEKLGIELPEGESFASQADFEEYVSSLKAGEAIDNFINDYANSVGSDLMYALAQDTNRTSTEKVQLTAFKQQIADMLGVSIEDITDTFIADNWDLIKQLGSGDEALVQQAMTGMGEYLGVEISEARLGYADTFVRGLQADTEVMASYAMNTVASAFGEGGDYSGISLTTLGAAKEKMGYTVNEETGEKTYDQAVDAALIDAGIFEVGADGNPILSSQYEEAGWTMDQVREQFTSGVMEYYDFLADAMESDTSEMTDSINNTTARILSNVEGFGGNYTWDDVGNVRAAVGNAQKYGGLDASRQVESLLGQAGDKAGALAAEFANIDWSSMTVEGLRSIVEDLGISAAYTDEELQGLINAMDTAIQFTNSLTQALNNYASDTELADKLRAGEDISAEDYARAEAIYGKEQAQDMFSMNANGTYSLAEGYDGSTVASQIEAAVIQGFQNASVEWGNANTFFGENGLVAQRGNENFTNAQSTEFGRATTDTALGYISENIGTLFPEVDAEAANQAIRVYQGSERGTEDLSTLLEAFGVSDISELFTPEVQQGIGRQAEESREAYEDSETRIQEENEEQAFSDEMTKLNLDKEEVEGLSETLQELAKNFDEDNKGAEELSEELTTNEKAAKEVAKEIKRYDRALESVRDNQEEWAEALESGNPDDMAKAIGEMDEAYSDMLDIDPGSLSEGFLQNAENLELMKEAAEGSEEAYAELQARAEDDLLIQAGIDPNSDLWGEINSLQDTIHTGIDDIEVGASIDDAQAIQAMNELINMAGMTAEQATNYLASMGVDAEVETVEVPVEKKQEFIDAVPTITYEDATAPNILPDGSLGTGTPIKVPKITYNSNTQEEVAEGTEMATALRVTSATKSSGGGFKHNNSSAGSGRGSGGRRPRGGGGRRGGGGGSRAPQGTKKKDSDKERYHTITNVLEDLTDAYDKVSKASDRAFGKARVKLLKQQEDALVDLMEAQEDYLDEIEANLKKDMDLIKSMDFGVELQFDENGTLLNFEELQNAMWDEYNSHINDKGEVIGMSDEEWKEYEEKWQERMDALAQYEETQDLWKEAQQQLQDYINQIKDVRLEQVTYAVEVDIEASENALEILEYLLEKIGDSAWDAAEAIANMGEQAQEYLGDLKVNEDGSTTFVGGQIETYRQGIAGILGNHTTKIGENDTTITQAEIEGFMNGDAAAIEKVKQMGLDGTLTDDEVQSLKDYHSQLLAANQALMDLRDNVHGKVLEAFQQFNEELQEGIDAIVHLGAMMQSYRNIVDIVGKENLGVTNTMLEAIGQAGVENKIDTLGGQKARVDSLRAMIADAEAKAASATTEEDKEKWKENIEEMKKDLADAEEDFMSSWEEALQSIQEQFELAVTNTIETFSDALAGPLAGSLDELQASFDRQNNLAERFLPEYEKIYELNKLNRDITNSINDTDNVKAKQELAKLQEEINTLEAEGTEVSRFQTEDLRRRYELKLAELALEEAKNAKSNVQMARNADGDWSYVYTADEEDVAAAEQTYEDRLFAIQQANAEYINEMQNSLIQAQADMASEIEAIMTDETLSMEEKMQKVNEIKEYYTEMFGYYSDELQYVMDQNGTAFEDTTLSALTGFQDLEDYNQNFYDATTAMMTDLDEAYAMWEENTEAAMEAAGTSIDGFADHLSEQTQAMVEDSDEARESVEDLGQTAVDTFADITAAVENWVTQYGEKINEVITKNEALALSFKNVLNEWSNFENKDNENPPTENSPADGSGEDEGGGNETEEPEYMGQITIQKGFQYWGYKSPKGGKSNRVKVVNDDRQKRTYKFTQMDTSTSLKRVYIPSEGVWVSSYDPNGPKRIKVEKFDTGGYTGSWGSEGRMAMLHEKEIVLNKGDTANLLTAVDMIRQVAKVIDLNAYSSAGFGSSIMGMASGSAGQFEQNVHITAEFPNATDRNEIYAAFTDIVNLASQYANR